MSAWPVRQLVAETPDMSSEASDLSLVQLAQKGDAGAFDALVRRYQHKVVKLVMRYVRDPAEAEDVAQEAFIKAYRALPRFRGDSAFYTWLYRIAINTAKNVIAARGRSPIEYDLDRPEGEESADLQARMKDTATPEAMALTEEIRSTVNAAIESLPEDLRNAIVLRELEGMSYEEIAAAILRHLRAAATAELGRDFEDVVISVPARFENAAREATRKAASLAGLHTLRLVNEPTAAALAYGREHLDERARILVFDFGGGTLDVTILEMFEGILDVRTSVGDDRLGGKDIDEMLAGHLRERFRAAHGRRLPPPSKDRGLARRLKAEAERIKIALSDHESVAIEMPDCDAGDPLEGEIQRSRSRRCSRKP